VGVGFHCSANQFKRFEITALLCSDNAKEMLGVKVTRPQLEYLLILNRCLIQLPLHLQLYGLLQRLIRAELLAPSRRRLIHGAGPLSAISLESVFALSGTSDALPEGIQTSANR
jgi:hypothetical protein